ncbi:MAG: fibronectin type III domain-containing protein [Oscillospiraceae bacterium]
MQMKKTFLAGILALGLMVGNLPGALAAEAHYNDASAVGGAKDWSTWTENWTKTATDYTKVSLAPGRDETQLNFAWYSKMESGKAATPIVHFGTDKAALTAFTGKAAAADSALTGGSSYDYNHVTVTGLKPSTTYYYAVERGGFPPRWKSIKPATFPPRKSSLWATRKSARPRVRCRAAASWWRTAGSKTPPHGTTPSAGTAP